MLIRILPFGCAAGVVLGSLATLSAQTRQPVLLISIDGMRPDYVTHADEYHLQLPTLRRMLAEGAHAEGVRGVFPTVTYPSHTTIITGVWPAEHGIYNNGRFDPERELGGAWYWYADQIKVPTLWSAAHAAGLRTASVSWPVTVGAPIDTLIPEYWRGSNAGDETNPDDRLMMDALSRPDGEVARIQQRAGRPYLMGNGTTAEADETRTVYSLDILKQHRPEFMTIHLSSLDEEEHLHGPFSAEANADLEKLDGMVGRLAAQELANYPNAVVAIVSDHGFEGVKYSMNLTIPFLAAGLIDGKVQDGELDVNSWKAEPWAAGGMAAVVLENPKDAATLGRVRDLLAGLKADSANGIEDILEVPKAVPGGFPNASFVVTFRTGYYAGTAVSGAMVRESKSTLGTHGFDPLTHPLVRASFFITGHGIAKGKDLGVVDMRQIAPTLAGVLGVSLPSAKQKPLVIR